MKTNCSELGAQAAGFIRKITVPLIFVAGLAAALVAINVATVQSSPSAFQGGGASGMAPVRMDSPAGVTLQSAFQNIYSFTGSNDGANPGALVLGGDGNLYGITANDGSCGNGTVFQVGADCALSTLYAFMGNNDGGNPSTLICGADGNLYGTTSSGTIFCVTLNGSLTTLYSFGSYQDQNGDTDGAGPFSLAFGTDGNLYGTAWGGGDNEQNGTAFMVTTNDGAFNMLWVFGSGDDGANPGTLVFGRDGNLYGTTSSGCGNIFMLTTNGSLTTLYSLDGAGDGCGLNALVQCADGNLYGAASGSGLNEGTIFCLSTTGVFSVIYTFSGTNDGGSPNSLIWGADGNLYGTTANGNGTVFMLATNGALSTLYTFSGGNDGANPVALAQSGNGMLYGVTSGGGANGNGTVFGLTPPLGLANQTVAFGGTAVFSLTTTGSGLSFQWYHGTNVLDGQTNSALTLTNVTADDQGDYSIVINGINSTPVTYSAQLTVAPSILTEPFSQAVLAGADAIFSVLAEGPGPLQYQWYFNSIALTYGTNATLTLTNIQVGDAGAYAVLVLGPTGSVSSSNAELTVYAPPLITCQPTNQAVAEGGTASFCVEAGGTAPLAYQWYFNGTNVLAGADTSCVVLTNCQASNGVTTLWVQVSNPYGATNSAAATLAILNCLPLPANAVAWWKGDGNANDSVGGNNGSAVGAAGYAPGLVNQALNLTGNSYSQMPSNPLWGFGTNDFSIELWVNFRTYSPSWLYWMPDNVFIADDPGGGVQNKWIFCTAAGQIEFITSSPSFGALFLIQAPFTPSTNQWYHLALVRNGSLFTAYTNGIAAGNQSYAVNMPNPNAPLTIGQAEGLGYVNGLIDEATIYSRALGSDEIQNIFNFGKSGKCGPGAPPYIILQPANESVVLGGAAAFSVGVGGTEPLAYQWYFNESSIAGATASSLVLSNVQTSEAGAYFVVVTNSYGSASSSNAVLTVEVPPAIQTQPANQTVTQGSNATFTVLAGGTTPLSYQWYFNQTNVINAATSAILILTNAQPANAGYYWVLVTNVAGSVASSNALLTIISPPTIVTAPANQTACQGGAATFYVTAAGTTPLGYQWLFDGTSIPGATGSCYTASNAQSANAGAYSVTVSNPAGTAVSSAAELTINLPTSATPLANQTTCSGTTATFSTAASGAGPFSFQWYTNGAALGDGNEFSGSASATLTVTPVSSADALDYSVVVSGACNSVTNSASLSVTTPPVVTTQPASATICGGGNVSFSVAALGTQPLSYQWYANGSPLWDDGIHIAGSGTTNLWVTNAADGDAGNYSVQVANACGSVASSNAVLAVNDPVTVALQSAFDLLYTFNGNSDGSNPQGPLLLGTDGNLYGVAANGGTNGNGTAFRLGANGLFTTLYSFSGANDGSSPDWLVQSANGLLYGSTAGGGANAGNGTLFMLATNGALTTLYSFSGNDGSCPGSLVLGGDGDLYGTTSGGGSNGNGTVFMLATNGALTTLYSFSGFADGSNPNALVMGNDGNLYGTTSGGGINGGFGTIFLMNTNGTIATLFSFSGGYVGARPNALVQAGGGNLFGTVNGGGANGDGEVFCLGTNGIFTTLYSFSGGNDGANPNSLLYGSNDNLYGTTGNGGTNGKGTFFQITTNGALATLYAFSGIMDGGDPGSVAQSTDGNFYGAANDGGANGNGTIFRLGHPATLANQTACPGGVATFRVIAYGTGLACQWFHGAVMLAGQTNNALTLTNIGGDDAGNYSVVLSGICGSLTNCAALTLMAAPSATGPLSQTNSLGSTVLLSTIATGASPLIYQWQTNGVAISDGAHYSGTTSPVLSVSNASSADATMYSVIVSGPCGNPITNSAVVTLIATAPAITIQPVSQMVPVGANVNFSSSAAGTPPLGYQWYFGSIPLSNATNAVLNLPNAQLANAGMYFAVVSNLYGSVTSSNAGLTVVLPPVIESQPTHQTVLQGNDATFGVLVSTDNTAPLSYQWYLDDTNALDGETNAIVTLFGVQVEDAGSYSVLVTNISGGVVSSNALLTVYVPPDITGQPDDQTVLQGSNATFSVNLGADSSSPSFYQWYFNGTNLVAWATNATLTLTNVQAADEGCYSVVVSNLAGVVTAGPALLALFQAPVIVRQAENQTVMINQIAVFKVSVTGTEPNYQWRFNGAAIAGATNSLLTLTNVQFSNEGSYSAQVWNEAGSVVSTNATLTVFNWGGSVPSLPAGDRLGSWTFDGTNWLESLYGFGPMVATNLQCVPDWSGNALLLDTNVPAILEYACAEYAAGGSWTYLICSQGSFDLWVKPDWNSASLGGTGPGTAGRLIEVGTQGATNDFWSLYLSPDGNELAFSSQTNGVQFDYLTANISWFSNEFYHVALLYSSNSSSLYLDGNLITNGLGVIAPPGGNALAGGFRVGSDASGQNQARCEFDNLISYSYPMESWQVMFDYTAGWAQAAAWTPPSDQQSQEDGLFGMNGPGLFSTTLDVLSTANDPGPWWTNGNLASTFWIDTNGLWLEVTNVSNGWSYLNLHNATNQVYAIWSATNLSTPVSGWRVEAEVWPTDTNCMPFSIQNGGRQSLFLLAQDWTGVTHGGNVTPDWWLWKYFNTLAMWDTNLDSQGRMLVFDFTNNLDPGELGHWRFDTNTWIGDQGQAPLSAANLALVPSWSIWATNAVQVDNRSPAQLGYHVVETTGQVNIALQTGTIRFCFSPDWASTASSGTGPGCLARLLELGTNYAAGGWWAMLVSPDGGTLSLVTQTNGTRMTNLTATIAWSSNAWHQIALTHSPSNSTLYVDGQAVITNGTGIKYWPNIAEQANGFWIGSDAVTGTNQARGVFDELETLSYPLPASAIQIDFQALLQLNSVTDAPNGWPGSLSVVIDSPTNSASFKEPATVSVHGRVTRSAGLISDVQFLRDSTPVADVTSPPYQFSWPLVPAGNYNLTAVARDSSGLSVTSAPVAISVTNLCTP